MDACKAELIVDLTSSGELHQQFGQSGGEQQSLSGVWKPPDDLLKLLSKTHFKQPGWRKNTGTFTHTCFRVNQNCEMKKLLLSHLSASSNTTYSTLCNFRFISLMTCMRRPGVPMILEEKHRGQDHSVQVTDGEKPLISKRYNKALTCQGFHEEQRTDHPFWEKRRII